MSKLLFIFSIFIFNLIAFKAIAQLKGPDINNNYNISTPNNAIPNLNLILNNIYEPHDSSSFTGGTFITFQKKLCTGFTMGITQSQGCGSGMFHMSPASDNALGIHFFGSKIGFSANPTFGAPTCSGYNSTPGYIFDGILGSSGLQIGYNQPHNFPELVNKATTHVIMSVNGAVTIGVTPTTIINTTKFKLFVAGGIVAEDVIINLQRDWSDYVFAKDYKLMPLSDVKSYITTNSHLPEVPPACEIAEKGLATGEMLNIHMKKIEELTLYLIQLKEENETLQKRLEALELKVSH